MFGKVFVGVIAQAHMPVSDICADIASLYGEVRLLSFGGSQEGYPFSHTSYYQDEMGEGLFRYFVEVVPLYPSDKLAWLKQASVILETKYKNASGQRRVNLDPGMLFFHNLILLSTKNFAHRIPLANGIYAEVTLLYHKSGWKALPWTFPDFQTSAYQSVFSDLRKCYAAALSHAKVSQTLGTHGNKW